MSWRMDIDLHVLRHVVDRGPERIGRVAGRMPPRTIAEQVEHLGEPVTGGHDPHLVQGEPVAEVERGEGERSARVFLLRQAVEIGAVADLGLHFLLAVPEVVVGDQGDDHTLGTARGELEGAAVIVELVLAIVGQADVLLPHPSEVRREDHAAAVPGPAVHVESGVVRGQVRVAGVAEDAFHEIEVAHQPAGGEEPDLEPLLGRHLRHRGTDQRPEQQAHHRLHRPLPIRREWQPQ